MTPISAGHETGRFSAHRGLLYRSLPTEFAFQAALATIWRYRPEVAAE